MRVGILVTTVSNFGEQGFYNAQEIGLAKALAPLCETVNVYKAVFASEPYRAQALADYANVSVQHIPTKQWGINGLVCLERLEKTLDVLIYFSDTQLSLPRVSKWATQNQVLLLPYIGVIESHSANRLKRSLMNLLFQRNLAVYQKRHCLAKTPAVEQALRAKGVKNISVASVGLDVAVLHQDYETADVQALKAAFGYASGDKVVLFIGRLTPEKQPLRMIQLFKELHQKDNAYRLLIIGKGELQQQLTDKIQAQQMGGVVTHLAQLPNADIWQLYRMADCFVNLNEQEIFGMAILEAMYYGCKVVALHAPGPDFVIEDGVSGCLAMDDAGVMDAIQNVQLQPQVLHDRVLQHFTWEVTANLVKALVEETYG